MNRYQKVAIVAGVIALLLAFGKTITKIGIGAIAFMGKGIFIVLATLFIFFALNKKDKKK